MADVSRHSPRLGAFDERYQALISIDRSGVDFNEMADTPPNTYCPVCERLIKTNARGLLHRHKAGTDRHTEAEFCPGSGQPPVDEATIIEAGNQRRRQALRQMTRDR
jgi:hypothetical protein